MQGLVQRRRTERSEPGIAGTNAEASVLAESPNKKYLLIRIDHNSNKVF